MKPIASWYKETNQQLAVKDSELEEVVEVAAREQFNHFVEDTAEGWKTLWAFKRPFIEEVIRKAPEKPETTVEHWFLGKLFGCGDEEVEQFIIANR